jgi:hypothetical protein
METHNHKRSHHITRPYPSYLPAMKHGQLKDIYGLEFHFRWTSLQHSIKSSTLIHVFYKLDTHTKYLV